LLDGVGRVQLPDPRLNQSLSRLRRGVALLTPYTVSGISA
jgi:hypothetical protein